MLMLRISLFWSWGRANELKWWTHCATNLFIEIFWKLSWLSISTFKEIRYIDPFLIVWKNAPLLKEWELQTFTRPYAIIVSLSHFPCFAIDIASPLPQTRSRCRFLLVCVDGFTSWSIVVGTKHATAETALQNNKTSNNVYIWSTRDHTYH